MNNGSKNPVTQLFALAEISDTKVIIGSTYGDDYMRVPDDKETRKIVEELLEGSKLIWKVIDKLPGHVRE